jgi:hypothetical protein
VNSLTSLYEFILFIANWGDNVICVVPAQRKWRFISCKEDEQWAKLRMIVEIAEEVWG